MPLCQDVINFQTRFYVGQKEIIKSNQGPQLATLLKKDSIADLAIKLPFKLIYYCIYYCLFKLGGTLIFNAEYCESFQLFLKCYQYLKLLAIFW